MEIFQTIWTSLSTPNIQLINVFSIPLSFIEITVSMLLFTIILNIEASKKQKILYVTIITIWSIISSLFINKEVAIFINIILMFLSIIFIFRISLLKAIIAEILPTLVIALFETIFFKTCYVFFGITQNEAIEIPTYRISGALITYLIIFCIFTIMKHYKINISILDNMPKSNKIILLCNFILVIITISTQFYLIGYYNEILPFSITLLSIISLIAYFFVSIYSLYRTTQLQITEQDLEEAQLYNKSLKILHDNVRAFKHDFSNIVQAIGRLCWY